MSHQRGGLEGAEGPLQTSQGMLFCINARLSNSQLRAMSKPYHIVAIGGGGGATQVLRAAQPFADQLSAIIAVTDTGRSTGLARAIGDIPAPGDLRATIAAFATDPLMARLLQHRFGGAGISQLEGMAFGNLLIAALSQVTGDFAGAVAYVERMVGCAAEVLPVAAVDTQLCAELA